MKIQCNSVPNFKQGQIITVPSENGVPRDIFWRKRLRDAAMDGCCEVVVPPTKKAKLQMKKEPNETIEVVQHDSSK
jgi:hypothetical protein